MEKLFSDSRLLDRAAVTRYGLDENLMMENAAAALERAVRSTTGPCTGDMDVLIITGSGNNGGDGMALARRLSGNFPVHIYCVKEPVSRECIYQKELALRAGVSFSDKAAFYRVLESCTVIVDCLFGSGFHGMLDIDCAEIIAACNKAVCHRIACDIPSGIDFRGAVESRDKENENPLAFRAEKTVTMGALKASLFSDDAKDFTGTIECADLGISRNLFENADASVTPAAYLLEKNDMKLPSRTYNAVNKGSFGHTAVVAGEKKGAAIIAGNAAFAFGTGLVTLVQAVQGNESLVRIPPELMYSGVFPENATAVVIGMGLGDPSGSAGISAFVSSFISWAERHPAAGYVVDADLCKYNDVPVLLEKLSVCSEHPRIVLTPHPKEFQSLLEICGFGKYTVRDIVENRLELAAAFVKKYPYTVLLLKGANTVVAVPEKNETACSLYIDPYGSPCLAKGGSGDVLSGLVGSLLAQGYSAEDAAVSGTLAHSLASRTVRTTYGMTPEMLVRAIRQLEVTVSSIYNGNL